MEKNLKISTRETQFRSTLTYFLTIPCRDLEHQERRIDWGLYLSFASTTVFCIPIRGRIVPILSTIVIIIIIIL